MGTDIEVIEKPVVLYDGVCNLCNGTVRFLIHRDPHGKLAFASLQSQYARSRIESSTLDKTDPESIILITNGNHFDRSDAILEIARLLGGIWSMFLIFKIIPKSIRDAMYDWVARNRYGFFGKKDNCEIPSRKIQERFLDW